MMLSYQHSKQEIIVRQQHVNVCINKFIINASLFQYIGDAYNNPYMYIYYLLRKVQIRNLHIDIIFENEILCY